MHLLQACRVENELADVVPLFAIQIFPELAGQLFLMKEARTILTANGAWNEPIRSFPEFPPFECWEVTRNVVVTDSTDAGELERLIPGIPT
ncbi:hypothetical protein JNB88_24660 [Rhizobium cauense]|uniref:hypothetical protein n=1 Tax=Rhizobium cauense TaxID=1166683 RepID=UPI001C6F5A64|nr:hypothetical protein [Rhizobium cauense]MBW9116825.1 hypothetical protein [Rhizobium cauense]